MPQVSGQPRATYIQKADFNGGRNEQASEIARIIKVCRQTVSEMGLNLAGVRVLTEAATGPYSVTPIIATLAGAEVIAVSRDSRWGSANEAFRSVEVLAVAAGVKDQVHFSTDEPWLVAEMCDLVTNLGFVRPIERRMIERLSECGTVSLMWEPWELREDEVDLAALRDHGVALIATNEHHPLVRTFDYLGPTAGRLLFDLGIEVVGARLALIGSDPFGYSIQRWLTAAGAEVRRVASDGSQIFDTDDAVILAEHRSSDELFTGRRGLDALRRMAASGVPIARISGVLNRSRAENAGVHVYPPMDLAPRVMSVTTAFVGVRPVASLHAAGLKAGADVISSRRSGRTIEQAIREAEANGFGLAVTGSSKGAEMCV